MNADIAYLAGVIDSDGCIRVERINNHGRSKDSTSYAVIVTIQQVEQEAIDLAATTFGGFKQTIKSRKENGRTMFRWTAKSKKAAAALRELLPFLRIKRQQAENALRLAAFIRESRSDRCLERSDSLGTARPCVTVIITSTVNTNNANVSR